MQARYQRDEYELDIQCSLIPQPVGINHYYNDQSANYHGQTLPGYMAYSTRGMLDYRTAWGNRPWDLNGRPTELLDQQSSNMNQDACGFVLSGQGTSTEMPQSIEPMTTPAYQSQPQSNINLSTISGITDTKAWNSWLGTSQDSHTVPMAIPSNSLYNIGDIDRTKSTDLNIETPDLVFGYMPMSTT
ncbi:hypothetical protein VN97_g6587 [Penicillium thymicola]|uniref:Uncharacterized protein n=1 Tax=Penicillium thymicola TaxID=293382 RepID=A0AAI9X7C6_PENTH|nr:hypothetical protein VN97_g6587 [Penicillium thymicola]